jgi:hypothetical protein
MMRTCSVVVLLLWTTVAHAGYDIHIANPLEARILTMWQPGPKHLRLDIGAAPTLWRADARIDVCVDFFTLTRLRTEGNLKFPVETIDYWFGVRGTFTDTASAWDARVRIAHVSTHLVDGYADTSGVFVNRRPFVYSREFIEALVGYRIDVLRPYAGLTYLWAVQPRRFDRVIPQAGVNMRTTVGGIALAGGYDIKLVGIDGAYRPQHAAQLGVEWMQQGTVVSSVNLYRYDGRSVHGMFADLDDHYWAVGFQLVF